MHYILQENDTIAAISTAPGKGGISIVKISGPDSTNILNNMLLSKTDPVSPERTMVYGHITDNTRKIDEVLACVMKYPHSYTGEDVVEIQSHGGYAAAEAILGIALNNGARQAEPGEFTKRAFLNGKIDLAQAEAVMEIVSADNREYLEKAEDLLEGVFSKQVEQLLSNLKTCSSLLEVNIDFSDHGLDGIPREEIRKSLETTIGVLDSMITSYKTAKRIKHGITVVIAGKVNTGKSSLFNALLGKKRAIVNRKKGTTRDWLEEKIELEHIPINLIDTAGIRLTSNEIESEGVRETEKLIRRADIIVYLHDIDDQSDRDLKSFPARKHYIHVLSKSDLAPSVDTTGTFLPVSSITREGIDELLTEMVKISLSILKTGSGASLVMVDRHRTELDRARKNLRNALSCIDSWSEEIISIELNDAQKHLEAVLGKSIDLDVLDEIFKNFCVGK